MGLETVRGTMQVALIAIAFSICSLETVSAISENVAQRSTGVISSATNKTDTESVETISSVQRGGTGYKSLTSVDRKDNSNFAATALHETPIVIRESKPVSESRLIPVRKHGVVNFENGCDPPSDVKHDDKINAPSVNKPISTINDKLENVDDSHSTLDVSKIVQNPNLRKIHGNRDDPRYEGIDNYYTDVDLGSEEDPDFIGADYPIIRDNGDRRNVQGIKAPVTKNILPSNRPKDEIEEEEKILVRPKLHNEPEEDVNELIKKLRRAGVSWNVINRELYGTRDEYLPNDYVAYRPHRHHYLHHRRHRPYYGRYPYYPQYAEEEYLADLLARRRAEKIIRPVVYYDDDYKKKK